MSKEGVFTVELEERKLNTKTARRDFICSQERLKLIVGEFIHISTGSAVWQEAPEFNASYNTS